MRVIVCGSRDGALSDADKALLANLHAEKPFSVLIHGACGADADTGMGTMKGVDRDAHEWALANGIPPDPHPAAWNRLGKKAGPIRNGEMASIGDLLVAFPDGVGTQRMVEAARRKGLTIIFAE